MDSGFTFMEIVVVLLIVGIGVAIGGPVLSKHRDRWAVVGAREVTVALLARARLEAIRSGGAEVTISEVPPRVQRVASGVVHESVDLESAYGVGVDVAGAASVATVSFDALGLGRLASRTIRFRRGDATASIIVSSYGRAVRR